MGIRRCTLYSNGTFFCTLFLQPTTSDIGIRENMPILCVIKAYVKCYWQ